SLELHGRNITAFLVESFQGEAGCVSPPSVAAVAHTIQHYRALPPGSTTACAPTLSSLVSAVLADRDIMLCITPREHGSTYGGSALLPPSPAC
ncbi:hypothetical protein GGX14DRAFT_366308, partial [Mycena pura]